MKEMAEKTALSCRSRERVDRLTSLHISLGPTYIFQRRTFWGCWCEIFTGQMPFLSPNQQCLSTGGTIVSIMCVCVCAIIFVRMCVFSH